MKIIWIYLLLTIASTSCYYSPEDELENIYSKIDKFISQEEKEHSLSLKNSIDSTIKIRNTLSQLNSTELIVFKHQFINMVDDFKIDTLDEGFERLLEHIETNAASIHDILKRSNSFRERVVDSLYWYRFLNWFRNYLDTYSTQKDGLHPDLKNSLMNSRDEIAEKRFGSFSFAESFEKHLQAHAPKSKWSSIFSLKI